MRGLPVPLALLALLGALSSAVAQETGAEAPAMVNPNPLSSLSLDSLSATRSLPLFTPSRTAPVPEAEVQPEEPPPPMEAAADPEQPPPAVELIGIVLTDETQTALLRDPASNEVHRVTNGDDLQGWAVSILDSRSVELRNGERVQGLKMFETFAAPAPGSEPQGPPEEVLPEAPPPPVRGPETQRMPPPDASPPDAADIVKGGDSQPTDAQDGAPLSEPPPPDGESPPPDEPPPADFGPRPGNSSIPEEGALSPGGDSNVNQ